MFKLKAKFDADSLLYSLSHFECYGHEVHMFTQQRLPPPLTSTVKSSLFMHVHSSPLSLATRLPQCHANHSCCVNNSWNFSGQTSYVCWSLMMDNGCRNKCLHSSKCVIKYLSTVVILFSGCLSTRGNRGSYSWSRHVKWMCSIWLKESFFYVICYWFPQHASDWPSSSHMYTCHPALWWR